jgi:hypothetical protein
VITIEPVPAVGECPGQAHDAGVIRVEVAGDSPARVFGRHAGLAAEQGDQNGIDVR